MVANAIKSSDLAAEGNQLDWKSAVSSFHVISARGLLAMKEMERHQNVREKVQWLKDEDQPLALLFISHRWETLKHPDPQGRHLRVLQEFLRRICISVEAMLVPRLERLHLVPSLAEEGTLQAEEVARRILGFGPFSDEPACLKGQDARRMISERFAFYEKDRPAFRDWLSGKIGVWLDYICMPQRPLSLEEEREFQRSLAALDSLVQSSTLVALRDSGDDYPVRGWCASEFFLASAHSFARNLFIDTGRLERAEEVAVAQAPAPSGMGIADAAKIMIDSYEHDLAAFREASDRWSSFEGPLIASLPPDPWAAYRDLQGSSFFAAEFDPNPLRLVLEAIRNMETMLIEKWLMSDKQGLFDPGKETESFFRRLGLRCALRSDMIYLGFLLACHGWIDAFKPLFRECLRRYLETTTGHQIENGQDSTPSLNVILKPLEQDVRSLFSEVKPSSAATWWSRLSTGPSRDSHERAVVEQVSAALKEKPLEFTFMNIDDSQLAQSTKNA
ncbi:MAG: hypothetical protein ABSE41_16840 [Bacteroidota bacterium]|jgi:hypothetical protein